MRPASQDESRKLFLDWAYNVFEPVRVKSPDILNRAEMQIKKIIMLFAINSMHDQIELEDVEAALKLWPSMLSIYQLMATSVGQSVMTQVEERILSIIKRYEEKNPNDALSPSKIYDRVNNNGNKVATREEISKALLNLERMGELKEVPPGKRPDGSDITGPGRRSARWAIA